MTDSLSTYSLVRACLLGGAVGDALGAPVEFWKIARIREHFGPGGIRDFVPAYGRLGAITDDTQMTLFTADGLLRAAIRQHARDICHAPTVVHRTYLRWLKTQGESPKNISGSELPMNGWLAELPGLWSNRAPGNTCLAALRAASAIGKPATNDSKGCGGVMRAAPVGLVTRRDLAFELGVDVAALTHGHPSGYLSAGFLALVIAEIVAGTSLKDAIQSAKRTLRAQPNHQELLAAVERAEALASSPRRHIIAEGELGQGWVAEEALAIALYCALAAPSFEEAVVLAVNHSGDSDSTGAIAGNLCGALYGVGVIPARWLEKVEMRDEITTIADDLAALHDSTLRMDSDAINARYPAW